MSVTQNQTVGTATGINYYQPYPNTYIPYSAPAQRPLRTGYTGGTFDLFHAGHVSFLRKCKALCDTLVVGLNTDEFVQEYKDRAPIMTFNERKTMLESCKYVDRVVTNIDGRDSRKAVEQSSAKLVIHGDDWTGQSYMEQMSFTQEWLEKRGITVVYVPYTAGISTTELINRIRDED